MSSKVGAYATAPVDVDNYRRQQIDKIAAAILRRRDGIKLIASAAYEVIRTAREVATQDKPFRLEACAICRGAVIVFEAFNYRFMFPAYVDAVETVVALLEAESLDDVQAYNDDMRTLLIALGGQK